MKKYVTFTKPTTKELNILIIVAEVLFALVTIYEIFDMFNIVNKHIENGGIVEYYEDILTYQNLTYHVIRFFPSLFFVIAKACQFGFSLLFALGALILIVRIVNIFGLVKKQTFSYFVSAFFFLVDSACMIHKIIYAYSSYSVMPNELDIYESIPLNIIFFLIYVGCFAINIVLGIAAIRSKTGKTGDGSVSCLENN